jgi:hypothetical protein
LTRKQNSLPRIPVRGTVHSYWLQQREKRKRRGASHKPQANKRLDKPVDLWDKVI